MANSNEYSLEEVKANVEHKFGEIRSALHMREKLLLRQLDVIANSQQMAGRGTAGAKSPTEDNKDAAEVKFVIDQETELLAAIRCFGRFQLDNMNLALQDVYLKNEDYIEPADDHETMYKCLQEPNDDIDIDAEDTQPEAIVVDFSRNKSLVEDNAKLMNKSIINITLQEAKDLIYKAKVKRDTYVPPLNLEELDDELESSIADAVSNLGRETSKSSSSHTCVPTDPTNNKPKSKKPRFKPKITINNCNGTINLRNIASLTINCANEEAVSAEIPLAKVQSADSSTTEHSTSSTTTASSSNYSSNASSRSQSKKLKGGKKSKSTKPETAQCKSHNEGATKVSAATTTTTDAAESVQPTSTNSDSYRYANEDNDDCNDTHVATCDFYNRLLNEIKKSLKEKPIRTYDNAYVQAAAADSTCDANINSASTSICSTSAAGQTSSNGSHIQPGKRLILKNFENLKIILEANSGDEDSFHPVQIEQWLAEIISETDLEPMQNTDILEHSKINNESN